MKKKAGSIRKQSNGSSSSIIKALPKDLLIEVLARVASGSFSDLCKVKITCRDFLGAAEDDYIYQHVSMEKFPLIPWLPSDLEFSFLKICRESGNSESLYREGMMEYFSTLKANSGLESLKMATQKGHKEAKYVYGMILMCSEDEEQRKQGLEVLRFLRMSRCIKRCRKRVDRFVWSMWVRNPIVPNRNPLCRSKTCHETHDNGIYMKFSRGWPSLNEDEDENNDIECEYCWWDHELSLFCDMFGV